MKRFIGMLRKELLHISRDVRTMILLFGMPVAQVLIFGFVLSNEIENVRFAVLDMARDDASREIVDRIASSDYFELYGYLDSQQQIEEVFRSGKAREVIVFREGFSAALTGDPPGSIQLILDAAEPNTASMIASYTSGIIKDYQGEMMELNGAMLRAEPEVTMIFNRELRGVYMFVPGIIAMVLILISALMTSVSITREKEYGSMEILLVSPLRPVQIVMGKVIPYIFLAFVDAVLIILMGFFVFGMPMSGSIALLAGETLLYIFLALSLGILISTLSESQQVAMFISLFALMLPTILLSGFIFPIENMPRLLRWLSYAMPPRYFIIIIKNIMIKGAGMAFVWKETVVLAGMTAFFLAMSVRRFKLRLE